MAWDNLGLTTQQIAVWTVPMIVFGVATLSALAVRQFFLRAFNRYTALLDAVRGPSVIWCVAIGLAIAAHNSHLPDTVEFWIQKSIGIFTLVSIGLVATSFAAGMVTAYGQRRSLRIAGLSKTLINLVIFSIVLLMILSELNVKITPILTALGVGGLAVALALQDTLANFFAGIHILVEEPLRVGDFIRLSKDEEGIVRDIGWRTTRIQTGENTIIVIPNQKITSGILTNFSLPELRVNAEVAILTAHNADPDQITAIALEAAKQTKGVLEQPEPSVSFDPGILTTHLQMKLVVQVAAQSERGRVQSELRAYIYRRFREQNIPFPVVKP